MDTNPSPGQLQECPFLPSRWGLPYLQPLAMKGCLPFALWKRQLSGEPRWTAHTRPDLAAAPSAPAALRSADGSTLAAVSGHP